MGLVIDAAKFRREMAIRGLMARDVAATTGMSAATIAHALSGRPVSARTLRAIAVALECTQPVRLVEGLLAGPEEVP